MKNSYIKRLMCGIVAIYIALATCVSSVFADNIAVSPMTQKIILNPGDTYTGSLTVFNPASSSSALNYKAEVTPFYADEDYNAVYESTDNYNQIVDWVSLKNTEGTLDPNTGNDIYYTIDVPANAPSGGQYFAIRVSSIPNDGDNSDDGVETNIKVSYAIAYMVFAEITGTTVRKGEIVSANVPSFLFDGEISADSSIKNNGNVHGTATYTLQVFPLFSNEEVFTNVEDPETHTILPDRVLYNKTIWSSTPAIGIFNVVYTVEFEGITTQVSKLVIKCPIWLLFIIILVIVALIIWIIVRVRSRKKSQKSED